jgi:hypothetical protein
MTKRKKPNDHSKMNAFWTLVAITALEQVPKLLKVILDHF